MRCGGITTARLPASVLGSASKAARLLSSARRQCRVRRRPGRRRPRLRGPAGRPGRRAGRRARPPGGPGPDRAVPGAGTRGQAVPRHRTGIPKGDNVHEVAQREAPESPPGARGPGPGCVGPRGPAAARRRGRPPIYGELSSARILPRASGSRSRPAFFRPGPSAVSLRRPARLPKTCATSSEAGEVSALSSSLRNSGREVERQAPHTEAQALARCARCRGSNRARCGRRRRNPSGPCSGSTSGSTGPGRPRPARRPGRDSRCRTGSRPGPGTRPSRGSRRGPARRRCGPRRRRHPRRGRRWRP